MSETTEQFYSSSKEVLTLEFTGVIRTRIHHINEYLIIFLSSLVTLKLYFGF